jgi:hypothetical protein
VVISAATKPKDLHAPLEGLNSLTRNIDDLVDCVDPHRKIISACA